MDNYLGVDGTAHKMSKFYVGIDNKARQLQKIYVGVDDKARLAYQCGEPIGSLAVGSIVKIKVDGTSKDFIIVYQGLPGSVYDSSCNGTWLLMKDVYTTSGINNSSSNSYKDSSAHSYLNSTFYNLIDSGIRAVIKQVRIPYHNGTGPSGSLATGSSGLSTKIFLLSATEVGFSSSYMDSAEGAKLPYFGNDSKRIAYNGSDAIDWWLRSPRTKDIYRFWVAGYNGSLDYWTYDHNVGIRPAFILSSDMLVDDNGNVMV